MQEEREKTKTTQSALKSTQRARQPYAQNEMEEWEISLIWCDWDRCSWTNGPHSSRSVHTHMPHVVAFQRPKRKMFANWYKRVRASHRTHITFAADAEWRTDDSLVLLLLLTNALLTLLPLLNSKMHYFWLVICNSFGHFTLFFLIWLDWWIPSMDEAHFSSIKRVPNCIFIAKMDDRPSAQALKLWSRQQTQKGVDSTTSSQCVTNVANNIDFKIYYTRIKKKQKQKHQQIKHNHEPTLKSTLQQNDSAPRACFSKRNKTEKKEKREKSVLSFTKKRQ